MKTSVFKIVKKVISIILITVASLFMWILFIIWNQFFDVTGLRFYDGEPVSSVVLGSYRAFYVITDNGYGYVGGGYHGSKSRRYRNTEFHENEIFGTSEIVRFSKKNIKSIISSEYLWDKPLFITEDNSLYFLEDLDTTFLASNVISAQFDHKFAIYAVGTDGSLFTFTVDDTTPNVLLASGIQYVDTYFDEIYVLTESGDVCRVICKNGQYVLTEALFSNVKKFDIVPFPVADHKGFGEKPDAQKSIINVLTNDNELYIKGNYYPEWYKDNTEWRLQSTNVVDFAAGLYGTVFTVTDNKCKYIGYDPYAKSKDAFGEREFPHDGKNGISVSRACLCIVDSNNVMYLYGGDILNDIIPHFRSGTIIFTEKSEGRQLPK